MKMISEISPWIFLVAQLILIILGGNIILPFVIVVFNSVNKGLNILVCPFLVHDANHFLHLNAQNLYIINQLFFKNILIYYSSIS